MKEKFHETADPATKNEERSTQQSISLDEKKKARNKALNEVNTFKSKTGKVELKFPQAKPVEKLESN